MRAGAVKIAYDESIKSYNRRLHQFLLGHNWHHTATLTMCPMAMTDGAASLLAKHLSNPDDDHPGRNAVLKEYYRRLTTDDSEQAMCLTFFWSGSTGMCRAGHRRYEKHAKRRPDLWY
jgi:hypothetical protein